MKKKSTYSTYLTNHAALSFAWESRLKNPPGFVNLSVPVPLRICASVNEDVQAFGDFSPKSQGLVRQEWVSWGSWNCSLTWSPERRPLWLCSPPSPGAGVQKTPVGVDSVMLAVDLNMSSVQAAVTWVPCLLWTAHQGVERLQGGGCPGLVLTSTC